MAKWKGRMSHNFICMSAYPDYVSSLQVQSFITLKCVFLSIISGALTKSHLYANLYVGINDNNIQYRNESKGEL